MPRYRPSIASRGKKNKVSKTFFVAVYNRWAYLEFLAWALWRATSRACEIMRLYEFNTESRQLLSIATIVLFLFQPSAEEKRYDGYSFYVVRPIV